MKKPNKKITRLVVWSVTSSLIGSSCSDLYKDPPLQYVKWNQSKLNNSAISIQLSNKQYKSYNHYLSLVERIISDRVFAKQFHDNPAIYLDEIESGSRSSEQIESDILVVDNGLQRFLDSFSDDDIMDAIDSGNVKAYLSHMKDKGLLNLQIDESYNILTVEDKKLFLLSLGVDEPDAIIDSIAVAAIVALFCFAVAVVSHIAGMYTAVLAANLAAGLTVAVELAAFVSVFVAGLVLYLDRDFDIWVLSATDDNDNNKIINLYDYDCIEAIDNVMQIYKELFSEELKDMDVERMINTVKLNINKQIELNRPATEE